MASSCAATSRAWPGSSAQTRRSRKRRRPDGALLEQPVHLRRQPDRGDAVGDLGLAARRGAVQAEHAALRRALGRRAGADVEPRRAARRSGRPPPRPRAPPRAGRVGAARPAQPAAGTSRRSPPAGWSCRRRSARRSRRCGACEMTRQRREAAEVPQHQPGEGQGGGPAPRPAPARSQGLQPLLVAVGLDLDLLADRLGRRPRAPRRPRSPRRPPRPPTSTSSASASPGGGALLHLVLGRQRAARGAGAAARPAARCRISGRPPARAPGRRTSSPQETQTRFRPSSGLAMGKPRA